MFSQPMDCKSGFTIVALAKIFDIKKRYDKVFDTTGLEVRDVWWLELNYLDIPAPNIMYWELSRCSIASVNK